MEALEEFDFDMAGQESVLDLPHHPHDDDEAPHLPLETPDVLEQAVVGEIPKKKKAKKKKAPDNPARTLKKLGNNKKKRKRDELSDLQRERLLAGAKQDAKEDFIEQRESILAQVPESAKAYFGQIGFSKWAKQSLPVLGVSPYQVPPGEVRESWLTMFHNLKRQDRLDTMSVLIYWYGAEDLGSCYGFIPRRNFVSYERGQAKKVHVLPEKTRKKIENGKKLNQEERNLQRALMEMEEDLELPPEERKRGIIDFPEVYDLIGMEDVDETMLNNDMEYYDDDDDDNDETNSTDPDEPSEPIAASVPKKKKNVKKEPVAKKAKKAKEGPTGSMVEEVVKLEEPGPAEPQTEPVGVGNVDMDDFDMDEQSEGVDEDDDEKDDDYHVDGMEKVEDENLDGLVGPPAKKPKKAKAAKVKKEEDDKPEAKKAPKKKKKSEATEKPKEPKDPKKVEQQEFKKCEKQHLPMLYALDDALQAEETDQIKSILTELAGVVDSFSAKFMEIYPWSAALKQTKALFQKKGVGLDHFTTVRNRFKEVYLAKKPNIPEDFNPKPKKRPKPASSGKEASVDQKLAAPRRASHSPPPKPKESKLTDLSESSARSFRDTIDHVPTKNPRTAVSARPVKQEANPKTAVSARPVKQEANPKTAVAARPVKQEAKPPPTKLQPKKSFSLTDWKRNYNTDSTNKESATTTTTATANVPTPSSAVIHRPLPAWLTDSSLEASAPKDDPRAFALEFLLQMASHFPKGKVHCHALAVSLEAAIYQWAYKIGGDWQGRYWKKVHTLVAAMMGKRKPGALIQLTLSGSFREPKDLVELDDSKLVASFEGQPVIL